MADFSVNVYDISKSGATFWGVFSGGDESYAKERYMKVVIGSTTYQTASNETSGGYNTFELAVTGLSAGTTYSWTATLGYIDSTGEIVWSTYTQSGSLTTTAAATRPSNWAWTSTIASGESVKISATEWNNFCTRINAFRTYKGLSRYSFTSVSKGTKISATIANQARTAIDAISGHGTLPSAAVSGGKMYASFFTKLASALNAIS